MIFPIPNSHFPWCTSHALSPVSSMAKSEKKSYSSENQSLTYFRSASLNSPQSCFLQIKTIITFFSSLISYLLWVSILSRFAFYSPYFILAFHQIIYPKLDIITADIWSLLVREARWINISTRKCSCWYDLFFSPENAILVLHTHTQSAS